MRELKYTCLIKKRFIDFEVHICYNYFVVLYMNVIYFLRGTKMSEKVCNCNAAENRREQFKELQPVLDQYAKVPGSLITILQKAQDIYGYLSIDTLHYISDALSLIQIYEPTIHLYI